MSGPSPDPSPGPSPEPLPAAPTATPWGADSAVAYAEANIDRYTPEALEAALVAAGYEAVAAREAVQRGTANRAAAPTRGNARRVVSGAYLLTYAALTVALFAEGGAAAGVLLAVILGGTLVAAYALSVAWLRWRVVTSLWALVSVPMVLLLIVGSACYFTTLYPASVV